MLYAADFPITSEILKSLIDQSFVVIGLIITGTFSVIAARRAKRSETHAEKAAVDVSVVRAETRNSHDPDRPMRHDLDRVLANQEQDRQQRLAFEDRVDREFRGLREDGVNQWTAINTALARSSATVRAAEHTVTEALKIVKE